MDDADNSSVSSSTNAETENGPFCVVSELLDSKERDEDEDDIGEYYFESDHLALKNNDDYKKLIRAVVVLQAQRTRALQDIDRLLEAKEAALADPIAFVGKLQRGEDLGFPRPQQIYKVPDIDWSKYTINGNTPSFTHKHMTRHKRPVAALASPSPPPPANDSNSGSSSGEFRLESDESVPTFVRGRLTNMPKSQTFNQLWTDGEQKLLEELLVKYPPEEVEARRWEKIAKALGNRTPQQVASRVQKYFIKLTKHGMPVPGRTPHVVNYGRRQGAHRHQRQSRFLFHTSTFFASHRPPVYMPDCDEDSTNYSAVTSMDYEHRGVADEERDEDIPPHLRNTAEYQELMYLKRLKKEKEHDRWQSTCTSQQLEVKCGKCGCKPAAGGQWWHCVDCPPDNTMDLCGDCSDSNFETSAHVSHHHLEPVGEAMSSFADEDYNYSDLNHTLAS